MKKIFALVLSVLMLLGILAGCGAPAMDGAFDKGSYYEGSYEVETMPAYNSNGDFSYSEGSPADIATPPAGRKWIVTVDISAETEDLSAVLSQVTQRTGELGGYIEQQNTSGATSYRERYAFITVRIPADKVDSFLTSVSDMTNVTSSDKRLDDVTLTYVDTESRVKALETEQDRLMELLAKAEDLSDILAIEDRLTYVRYELESAASALRVLGNQIDYATVNLHISEVKVYTPVAERTYWQRITDGFAQNLSGVWEFLQDFSVWFITSLPTFVLLAVVIVPCVILIRRRRQKKAAKRAALLAEKKDQAQK